MKYTHLILFTLIFIFVVNITRKILINHNLRTLTNLLINDEKEFTKKLDSTIIKFLLTPFTREYMRLNYYIIHKYEKKLIEQIAFMETKMRLSNKQLRLLLYTSFEYFISSGNKNKVKEFQRKLIKFIKETEDNHNEIENINLSVTIFIDNDTNQIPYITEKIKENDKDVVQWYIRRAHLYNVLNNNEQAINDLNSAKKIATNENTISQINDIILLYTKN